jgi:hypothetical protein
MPAALIVNSEGRYVARSVCGWTDYQGTTSPGVFSLSMVTASPLHTEEKICSDFADNLTTLSLKYSKTYYFKVHIHEIL